MGDNKSRIIYEPSFVIQNPKVLTSLCMFYDEVMLFNSKPIDDEIQKLEELKEKGLIDTKGIAKLDFINGPLKILSNENVLNVYDAKKCSEVFVEANELDLDLELIDKPGHLGFKIQNSKMNNLTKNIVQAILSGNNNKITVSELIRAANIYSVAEAYSIPIFSGHESYNSGVKIDNKDYVSFLSENLAIMSICELALPEMVTQNPEDILIAREKLKDELLEFKAGILELTYLLHQKIDSNRSSYNQIANECTVLINTKIKASLISLENKINKNKNKRIKNMIVIGAKLLLSGGNIFTCANEAKSIIESGISIADNLSSLINIDKPEHKIASYIFKFNNRFNK
ncbi:hypothetical protein [Clostridium estertheticum]|uniref:Uncharacterized protein n=1 Tax=Clostridium estertheticum subsp. estertheticum TaxID=1552 RepID=A0A1J0GI18_9CLOT|nr:hypothetical protein [Clostridium estertheticum]APC41036.1 hypothetical protein A7L45_13600 [Clostridium estertheticum subsp. estertheticum]